MWNWLSSRMQGVQRVATQAFEAGRAVRRLAALPTNTRSINAVIRSYGTTALARSRFLCINNPYAKAAKGTFVASLVGYGIKPSKLGESAEDKAAIQQLWNDWVAEADADGVQDLYGLQALVAGELFEAGEAFVLMEDAPQNATVPLRLRVLPSEMLPIVMNIPAQSGNNRIEMGIEFDASGNRVAYHFLRAHPGDYYSWTGQMSDTIRIEASRVLHIYKPLRAGQIRGVPHTLASMVALAMLDLYDDAELERKRVAALFAAFITKPASESGDDDHPLGKPTADTQGTTDSFGLQPGAMVDLRPGEQVQFATPADVGQQFEAFQLRTLLRIASGFGVPYAAMTGDLRQANYGSIRAGLLEFKRRTETDQWSVMVHQLCRPVWLAWLRMGTMASVMPWTAAEFVRNRSQHQRVKWIAPKWDWVDPQKDIAAEKVAVDNGFKARADVIDGMGEDPEEVDARIAADQQRAKDLGIELNTGATPPAAPDQQPQDGGQQPPSNGGNANG